MKRELGVLAAVIAFASNVLASDIFVRQARGRLNRKQANEITSLVKAAVGRMSEHRLVRSLADADFSLQPSVVQRGDELLLRVEKLKNGEILAMSEESLSSITASSSRAMAVTETALSDVNYGQPYATDNDGPRDEAQDGTRSAQSIPAGELAAASPGWRARDTKSQVQLGVGPSFALNMRDNDLMYDLMAAYAIDFDDAFNAKVFSDINLGAGDAETHFINLGVAGAYSPALGLLTFGKPYFGGDVGYAFTRDGSGHTGDGASAGLTTGFKFMATDLNWDVAANYTMLLARIADATPQVVSVRVALAF